jgi:hypothetical protein
MTRRILSTTNECKRIGNLHTIYFLAKTSVTNYLLFSFLTIASRYIYDTNTEKVFLATQI